MLHELKRRTRQVLGPLCILGIIFYIVYHVVQGDRGLLALLTINKKLETAQETLDQLKKERAVLEHRIRLLRPPKVDKDLLEEQARRVLGFLGKDDILVIPEHRVRALSPPLPPRKQK